MKVKSLVALLLVLALCAVSMIGAVAEESTGYQLGDKIEDFSFTGYDGTEYTLYGLLEEKQMVLLNFWATWCGPCRSEFPMMDAAYQTFQDNVAVVALSTEADDTNEVIAQFAADNSMSFIVGRDETNLYRTGFYTGYIPTTIVVDRFGTICYYEYGSVTAVDAFERLFATFVGDDYTESVLMEDGIPAKLPDVDPADPADLAAAIGSEGVTFVNPTDDEYNWPVKIVSEGDRDYVVTTNQNQGGAISSVDVQVTAAAGDVLVFDYKVSTEADYDYMTVYVNDELVKMRSGEVDWTTWAYAFTADGDYTVTLAYEKDEASDEGDDAVCFDNVALLSGDEAAAALAALPVYPTSDATTLVITNEDAKLITIDDPTGLIARNFPDAVCYIVPADSVSYAITLAAGCDAENASVSSSRGGSAALVDCIDGDGYTFVGGINSMETTGRSYTYTYVFDGENEYYVLFFASEQNLNTFFTSNLSDDEGNFLATWEYADGSEHTTTPDDVAVASAD